MSEDLCVPSMRLCILISYAYWTSGFSRFLSENMMDNVSLIIDSGAFTASRTGKKICIEKYMGFLDSCPVKPDHYMVLDVIGDPVLTQKNLAIMLSNGFSPMPVFTHGESYEKIDELYEHSDVIGIGCPTDFKGHRRFKYMCDVSSYLGGRKAHMLGLSRPVFIEKMMPHSCDSSNASRGRMYGKIDFWMGGGKVRSLNRSEFILAESQSGLFGDSGIKESIVRAGENYDDILKCEWRRSAPFLRTVSFKTWIAYSNWCSIKKISNVYLAIARLDELKVAFDSYRWWTKNREKL